MSDNGYIKLHRKIRDWGWYSDPYTKVVFLELLLTANWDEPGEYKGITINTGDVVVGRTAMAKKLGISERSVRTALNHLKSTSEVTIKTTNKFTVVTIVKWRDYQASGVESDQQNDQQSDQQVTNNRPTSDHIIRNKEIKNKENKEFIDLKSESASEKPTNNFICNWSNGGGELQGTRTLKITNREDYIVTSDGREFLDPWIAESHEKFLKAKAEGKL